MTLRCSCGGAVTLEGSNTTADYLHEIYECPSCGLTGTYEIDAKTNVQFTTGCVTRD